MKGELRIPDGVYVREVPFPAAVRSAQGLVLPEPEGGFCIYIDARLPEETKRRVLAHELRHLEMGHFDADDERDVLVKEAEADGRPAPPAQTERYVPVFSSQRELSDWLMRRRKK